MAAPEMWGGETHTQARPGGLTRPGMGAHGDVGWRGACLEACRVTGHQHLSGFIRVNLAAHSGLVNKGQSGKHQ